MRYVLPTAILRGNAAVVAKDMLTYYYSLEDETEVITGTADSEGLTSTVTD